MLITVEGCDRFGKSTLIKELSKHYPNAVITKEPGSPHVETNSAIREMVLNNKSLSALQRELLFYVDAIGHKRFLDVVSKDRLVLSDRGIITHYAYLYGYMKLKMLGELHENWELYQLCKKLITSTCKSPDAIIYMDGDVNLMEERKDRSEKDAIENLPLEYFAYVLAQFDDLISEQEVKRPVLRLNARDSINLNVSKAKAWVDHLFF